MKLNNKGFAITVVLYGLLILFVILISSYLMILSARKSRTDSLIKDIEENYLKNITTSNTPNNNDDENNIGTRVIYTVTLNPVLQVLNPGTEVLYYEKDYEKEENKWYSNEEATLKVTAISKPKYVDNTKKFMGYYTGENGKGTQIIDDKGKISNNSVTGNITLYAYWINNGGGGLVTE